MTNPFADIVNKVRARLFPSGNGGPVTGTTSFARLDKSSHERLSKTVMPNSTRTIAPQEPLQAASTISGPPNAISATKTGPRMISLGGASQSGIKPHELPPAIALALEPKVERAISLQLSDILAKVPAGYIKSEESFDPTRRVLLKALEIEQGMATRNPSVALTSIYEQIPDIFMRSVPLTDQTRIMLPFEKVLERFTSMQNRRDQAQDEIVPQVDTPFLIVALEESEKFGTTIDPIQTSALPAVKVVPASAEAFAAAEPEAAESEKVTPQNPPKSIVSVPEPAVEQPPSDKSPVRIPFNLPPKGTGGPASERVPASSGPPVLSSPPSPPSPSEPSLPLLRPAPSESLPVKPGRNPFEAVPFDQLKLSPSDPKSTLPAEVETSSKRRKPTPEDTASIVRLTTGPKNEEEKIGFSLRVLLQNLPAFQRKGDPNLAPEEARVEFPLALLAGQLATGRVSVPSHVFLEAIPAEHRYLFHFDDKDAPVLFPLQEVLKNMPATALQMREDQEKPAAVEKIETPFSVQADQDAKRFKKEEKAEEKAEKKEEKKEEKKAEKKEPAPVAAPKPVAMPSVPVKEAKAAEKLDVKQVVARATSLPGVDGCAITFSDGLNLAGNLPAAMAADGLCAVAPTLLQRIDKHMVETKLGALDSMTLQGSNLAVSFFMRGNICLSALHASGALPAATRTELMQMITELSKTYAQPEIANVDH